MRLSIITDEISQDLERALEVCEDLDVKTIELRAVDRANVVSHDEDSLERIKAVLDAGGFDVCSISSPFLKCHLHGNGMPHGATHFAAPTSREGQWAVLDRALRVANFFGAPVVRAFSFWRVPDPRMVREEIASVLAEAAARTGGVGLMLALENEHECNVGTGSEAGWMLDHVPSSTFGLVWDPGNEAKLGSKPFPEGYGHVRGRVSHVHLKDVDAKGNWTKVGEGLVAYPEQLRALAGDSYGGALSLETHYSAPNGGQEQATRDCVAAIRSMCDRVGIRLEN